MIDRASLPGSGLFLLLAALSIAAHAGDWRQAKVHSISTRAQVDTGVNFDCAPVRPDQPDGQVMVVTYRVGKSLAWRAVDLSPGDAFTPGEEVRIDVAGCRVEHRASPTTAAASAP